MLRRRRPPGVTVLAAAAAVAALTFASTESGAQTPSAPGAPPDALLQPSLSGNPATPPRFHRPGDALASSQDQAPPPGTFTALSRIGATPVYGSPSGFGAGDTGFDSTNTKRQKKKVAQTPPAAATGAAQPETTFEPVPAATPAVPPKPAAPKPKAPPDVHPRKAAERPGAVLPPSPDSPPVSNPPPEVHPLAAASRAGATIPIPPPAVFEPSTAPPLPADIAAANQPAAPQLLRALPPPPPTQPPANTLPLNMLPPRPLPIAEGDPYAALGLRAGSFILLPSLDLVGAYNSNPLRSSTTPTGAAYFVGLPELQAVSDWDRHSLTADIVGSYTEYDGHLVPSLNVPYFSSKIDGRIDATRDTQIVLENRFLLSTDNPGSPNLQAQLARLPINTDLGGTLGVIQEFNRLSVAALGTFDRAVYDASLLTNGEEASNSDRNFNQYAGILRVGYDLDPGLKPFVQVQEDERVHDLQFDRNGLQRSSDGTSALVGGDVDLFGSLTGEMAAGWTVRSYQDPTLPKVSGFIANGALTWQVTPLTTARLGVSSQVSETIVDGASGQFSHDLNLEVDHAFTPWLIGLLKAGYGTDDYVGSLLHATRYFVSAGVTYKMTREVQLRGEVRQDWQMASESAFTFTATSFLFGAHLQR